ncbi:hypothetical protein NL676_007910 [Syzygium grande]|nr:hypothetical protein NL676_007910 [Syzygium grande]
MKTSTLNIRDKLIIEGTDEYRKPQSQPRLHGRDRRSEIDRGPTIAVAWTLLEALQILCALAEEEGAVAVQPQ